jgi:adenosylhomocysteine nucleosidase
MRLGIISALHEEQQGLVEAMERPYKLTHGMRDYFLGQLWEIDAVCVLSRIGKVAAALTTATLVEKFGVTHILFTGVAGAGDASIRVGDIVVAESLVQHDMDASPLFPRYEVPLTGLTHFLSDHHMALRCSWPMRHIDSWKTTSHLPSTPGKGPYSRSAGRGCIEVSSPAPTSS